MSHGKWWKKRKTRKDKNKIEELCRRCCCRSSSFGVKNFQFLKHLSRDLTIFFFPLRDTKKYFVEREKKFQFVSAGVFIRAVFEDIFMRYFEAKKVDICLIDSERGERQHFIWQFIIKFEKKKGKNTKFQSF